MYYVIDYVAQNKPRSGLIAGRTTEGGFMSDSCQQESAAPTHESYDGAAIKDITLHGGSPKHPTHIGIRLVSGKYIEVIPSLSTCFRSITAQLEVSRGGWFE